jgi:type IV secretion system protein VirB5
MAKPNVAPKSKGKPKKIREPYLWARRTWDLQAGRANKTLVFWRILTVVMAVGWVFTVVITWSHISKPKLVPYVVTIADNRVNFEGKMVGRPVPANDAAVRNAIITFIRNTRTVSSDPVLLREMLQTPFYYAAPGAQNQLEEYIRGGDPTPFEMQQDELRRDIRFTLFEKVAERTWRAEWVEQTRQSGSLRNQSVKTGTFTYMQRLPENTVEAERNPMGIYFTEFFITERRSESN